MSEFGLITITWWQLVSLFNAANRPWYHVDMLSLLTQVFLKILHKVKRVWLFLTHWIKVLQASNLQQIPSKTHDSAWDQNTQHLATSKNKIQTNQTEQNVRRKNMDKTKTTKMCTHLVENDRLLEYSILLCWFKTLSNFSFVTDTRGANANLM